MEEQKTYKDVTAVQSVWSAYKHLKEMFSARVQQMRENYEFLDTSKQYTEEQRRKRLKRGKPAEAFNMMGPIARAISGMESRSRRRLRATGRTAFDERYALVLTELMHFYEDKSDFNGELSQAYLDAVIGGYGVVYTNWEIDKNGNEGVVFRRFNPERFFFDPDASRKDLADASYIQVSNHLTLEEILLAWGDDEDLAAELISESKKFVEESIVDRVEDSAYPNSKDSHLEDEYFDEETQRFLVVEHHERRAVEVPVIYVNGVPQRAGDLVDENGEINEESWENLVKYKKLREQSGDTVELTIKSRYMDEIWVKTVIPAFDIVLEEYPYDVQNGNFLYTPIWCYDYHYYKRDTTSLFDELRPMQKVYNRTHNDLVELVMKFTRRGVISQKGNITDKNQWEDDAIGKIKEVNNIDAVRFEETGGFPQEMFALMNGFSEMMRLSSGVTEAVQGRSQYSQEPQSLFRSKIEQFELAQQYQLNNLDYAKKVIWRNAVDLVVGNLEHGMAVRILTDDEEVKFGQFTSEDVELALSMRKSPQYDVVLTDLPDGQTARRQNLSETMEFLNVLSGAPDLQGKVIQALAPGIISDLPIKNKSEVVKLLKPSQEEAEMSKKMVDLEMREREATIARLLGQAHESESMGQESIADAEEARAKAEKALSEAQLGIAETNKVMAEARKTMAEASKIIEETKLMASDGYYREREMRVKERT